MTSGEAWSAVLSAAFAGLLGWAVRISSTVHQLRERLARLEGPDNR